MIYKNQSVKLELDTKKDISAGTSFFINYKRPDGTTGSWTAAREGTVVTYTTDNDDLNIAGMWLIQSLAIIGGLNKFGKEVNLKIHTLL